MPCSILLAAIALVWQLFAALSGAEQGLRGFLANLRNALPWLGLLVIALIAFRWRGIGGSLALTAGVATFFFFDAWSASVVLFGLSLPIVAAGAILIICSRLESRNQAR